MVDRDNVVVWVGGWCIMIVLKRGVVEMKNVMVVVMVMEGRFGMGSWRVEDGDNLVREDDEGERVEDVVLDDVEVIKEGEVLCGSGDDGVEYVMWCGGKELMGRGREEFVKYGEELYKMGGEFGEYFDRVMEVDSGVMVDFY